MDNVKIVDYILERAEKHLERQENCIKAGWMNEADTEHAIVQELQYIAGIILLKSK